MKTFITVCYESSFSRSSCKFMESTNPILVLIQLAATVITLCIACNTKRIFE